jgi:hypothetical protein
MSVQERLLLMLRLGLFYLSFLKIFDCHLVSLNTVEIDICL